LIHRAVVFVLGLGILLGLHAQLSSQQPASTLTYPSGARGITGTPQGIAILRTEEARAPTPADLQLLVEGARSVEPHIQLAAIQALGRLERRDVVTELLPHLRAGPKAAREEAVQAIGQSMRGDVLPLDPSDTQVNGVQQALLAAATAANGPMAAVARTLGRLPYRTVEQVAKTHAFLRQVLSLSSQLDRPAASSARVAACAGVELLARLHGKLFRVPEETLVLLRDIATARVSNVKHSDVPLRLAALQALVSAGAVDEETLRLEIGDALDPSFRRLSLAALGGAGSPVAGPERLDYLRTAFRDHDPTVRYEALRSYARHHLKVDGCGPVLEMLLDRHEHVALLAIDTLGSCVDDEDALNRLIAEARTPPSKGSWRRESHALVSLAKRSLASLEVPLLSHSQHNVWQVRMYAARAASIANHVITLERLALDSDDNVREAAIGAVRRLKGSDAEPYLVAALARNDYQLIRTTAREMAGLAPTPGLTTALLEALARVTGHRKDTSRDTRIALLQRLRELGSERNAAGVEPVLRDYDAAVAAEAATTLGAWSGRTYTTDWQPLPADQLPSAAEIAIVTTKVAVLDMEGGQQIGIRLDPVRAPLMSTRFLRLTNRNYFDGLTFHRVVPNFVIQGGSPGANEYAGDKLFVKDEISARTHAAGTVGLSTRGRDTGDAQFFINLVDNPRLDFEYTVFGTVCSGNPNNVMEGDRIVNVTFVAPANVRRAKC
jgi:cyclophilin family peptidyl-prolyl cis-trans isomerase/HEAT repeat protein